MALARRHRLLEVLLDCLLGVLRSTLGPDGRMRGNSPELEGGLQAPVRVAEPSRALYQLTMALVYDLAALLFLSGALKPRACLFANLTEVCRRSSPLHHPGRLYLRIAADLHLCLSHPPVVLELLSPAAGPHSAALFHSKFLEVFRLVQGANPLRWMCFPVMLPKHAV